MNASWKLYKVPTKDLFLQKWNKNRNKKKLQLSKLYNEDF